VPIDSVGADPGVVEADHGVEGADPGVVVAEQGLVAAEHRLVGADPASAGAESAARLSGTERSPAVLRQLGLIARLGPTAADGGDLPVRIRRDSRDPTTGVLAWADVADMTSVVRRAVERELVAGHTPVLIGGCCALEPAALAGARSVLGQVGIVHIDGHLDLYDGTTSPTGEAADMPMAVILGKGPAEWVETLGTPVPGVQAAVLGHRDQAEIADGFGDLAVDLGVDVVDADTLRGDPAGEARRVADRLSIPLWIHLDVDVLDQDVCLATDYLMPGGLTWTELRSVLMVLLERADAVGFSLACYNPDKDRDSSVGRALVDMLAEVLPLVGRGVTAQGVS
jgi:arginase